jgi:UDP-N-acetylglucosamine acyltransferase
MATVHASSIVDPAAKLHETVKVGPFCIVGPNVEIGANTVLHSHVVIDGHTTIGEDNKFFQGCSIGAPPQDNSYKGEPTRVVIGKNNTFREYCSVHRGTLKENHVTTIGDNSLFMAYVHVGHDVVIGNNCTIANSTNFAGHVRIGDRVGIGGGTQIQQWVSLGRGAYIGGGSALDRDIPSFCTAVGNRAHLKGINIIGMKRQGYSKQEISEVVDFLRTIESSNLSPRAFVENAEMMTEYKDNRVVAEMSEQIKKSEIGIAPFNP